MCCLQAASVCETSKRSSVKPVNYEKHVFLMDMCVSLFHTCDYYLPFLTSCQPLWLCSWREPGLVIQKYK